MIATRRTIARACAAIAIAAGMGMSSGAFALDYPNQTVRLVTPFPPGGSTDLVARLLAQHLGEKWKQTVIVENKPGGNGMLGPTYVAKSKPDGYTILFAAPSLATSKASLKDMPIDPEHDLAAISLVCESPYVISVNSKLPVKTLQELIDYAKANPGKLDYGSFAVGSRLTTELFKKVAGVDITHVGYRGEALMMAAVAAGEVQVGLATPVNMREHASRGAIRILASTGAKRMAAFPDVPTTTQAGLPGFQTSVWFGLFAPAGTDMDIRKKIAAEVAEFGKRADVIEKLQGAGFTPAHSSPDELQAFLAKDIREWIAVAKAAGIEPQ